MKDKHFLKEKQGALGNQLSKIVIDKFKKHENSIKSAEKLVQQQFVEHLDIFDDLQNMILSDKTLTQLIDKKDLIVEPLTSESVQPGSIDCRLGNHCLLIKKNQNEIFQGLTTCYYICF